MDFFLGFVFSIKCLPLSCLFTHSVSLFCPQAAHLGIHFYNIYFTSRDAPPQGAGKANVSDREKYENVGLQTRTFRSVVMCATTAALAVIALLASLVTTI